MYLKCSWNQLKWILKNKAPLEDTFKIILETEKKDRTSNEKNEKWINEWIYVRNTKGVRIHHETDEKEPKQGKDLHIKLKYQLHDVEKRCQQSPYVKSDFSTVNHRQKREKNEWYKGGRNLAAETAGGSHWPETLDHQQRCDLHSNFSRFNYNFKIVIQTISQLWNIQN